MSRYRTTTLTSTTASATRRTASGSGSREDAVGESSGRSFVTLDVSPVGPSLRPIRVMPLRHEAQRAHSASGRVVNQCPVKSRVSHDPVRSRALVVREERTEQHQPENGDQVSRPATKRRVSRRNTSGMKESGTNALTSSRAQVSRDREPVRRLRKRAPAQSRVRGPRSCYWLAPFFLPYPMSGGGGEPPGPCR